MIIQSAGSEPLLTKARSLAVDHNEAQRALRSKASCAFAPSLRKAHETINTMAPKGCQ